MPMREDDPDGFLGLVIMAMATLIALLFLLACFLRPAYAHDAAHPELDGWFKHLRAGNKVPCCDGSDAVHVADPDWESNGGHYRVKLEGDWVDVPPEAVISEPNLFGPALVWPYYVDGKLIAIRCFMPGTLS